MDLERLDDWCVRHGVARIDLVKMDVDGNEYPILMGGRDIILACRPIMLVEAVGPHFEDDCRNPFRLLERLGYRFQDAQSGYEFTDLVEIRRLLPAQDWAMTKSINIIARADRL